jgi:ATP-binding cassette subfamily B protein
VKKFPFYKQPDQMDCGPTCLRMIAKHYGKNFSLQRLREISGINREGVSLLGISEAAEKIGFRTMGSRLTTDQLSELEFPAILHWNQNHFVVLYKIKKDKYYIADPGKGLIEFTLDELKQRWISNDNFGIALKTRHAGRCRYYHQGKLFTTTFSKEYDQDVE